MTVITSPDWYAEHGPMTDLGPCSAAVDALPDDIGTLTEVVQGMLVHDAGIGLYGLTAADFPNLSRQTLPAAERLSAAMERGSLTAPRPPVERTVGTCRDYAVLLTALLRQKGVPARVRCGFANYFTSNPFDDHWVTEYRPSGDGPWILADAQLDAVHRDALGIDFDPLDMPRETFLTAGEAWQAARAGADPDAFGHGSARGHWFLRIDLARDLLALAKRETSDWDGWRAAPPETHTLDQAAVDTCDALAALTANVDDRIDEVRTTAQALRPFWLA